ncbi:hypothetical protein niasHT_010542 [Heterodera trifolii]|uniref:polynucleotide adenylyltransferase n=1 Tax=Heterodera trifolii TaxID=157864 RepID=A0ABD2L2A8_9BILA
MSGLELIRRFSIMFPLDKMIMIWPTVRKCRVSREVADWVLLTHDPSIPIKDQQIIPYQEKCAELIAMVRKEPNNELIHSLTLYRLIRRLNPFKGIFSGAAQQIELAKDRLLATLGSIKEFELLEKALPEQLHIEALCPSHRESLYARVLLNRSGTEMAQKAEHRFSISLLLGYFKLRLAVKLNVGTTQATDTRMALGVMRSQVYNQIDNAEGLCWMMHLVKFVDGGGSFILPPEPLIFDCMVNDGKVPQFKQITERIRKWHFEFLSSQENGIPFVSVFLKRSVAGTVTRLKRLLGKKLFDKLCAKCPQMCQYPDDVFDDDQILTSFYTNAILYANRFPEIERMSAKLAADIIVFVRWFDAEPKGQYICEYWRTQREELKILYDTVFDENLTDHYGLGRDIAIFELTSGVLKQFLITYRHCDHPQMLTVVWQKLVKELETESERLYSAGGNKKQGQQRHNPMGTEVREWLNQLHADQLKRVFLNQKPMVKTNGEEHGKTEEKYDPIAEFATLMQNGKENGTNTGKSSKNNKKKKAKKAKKEQNEEKENGKDTKNTSVDKISQDKVSTFDGTNENVKGDKVSTKNREDQLSEEKESTKSFYDTVSFAVSEKMPKNDAKGNCQTDKVSPYEKTDDNDDKASTNLEGKENVDKTQNKEKKNKINEEEMLKFDNNDKTSTKINGDKMTQSKDKVATKKKQRMSSITKHKDSGFDENFEKNYENKNWLKIGEKLYRNWLARTLLSNGERANAWGKLGKDFQTQAITLEQILTTNGHGLLDTNKTQEINENFNKIRTVIKEWSKGQSDLLLSGSMMLGAFTTDSDVDTICVSPEHIQADQFFGTVPCHQKFAEECRNDDSLFCRLCFHPEVHSLQRIQSNWVPLIRLKLINFDHEIDIVFASIPGEQQIDADDLRQQNILTKFEEMIEKLDNKIKQLKEEEDRNDQASLINAKEQRLKSLRSLAGYHSNLKLLEMVKKNNNFHKLLLLLKLWAKSNYIYNNAMGFFNGTSLGILAAKIVLLYPEATVPFLLERFFFTYSSWEWPLPVQIAEIRPNSSLNWNAWDEQNHLLSQYGSGPYSNLMYSQYFAITCVASDLNIFNEFCGFVVTRIRVQLTRLSDCTRDDVDFCHVILLNGCPPYTVQKYTKISSQIFCKTWLVGVKMKNETQIQSKQGQVGGHLQQNDIKLKQELDDVIVNSYKFIGLGGGRRGGANLNLAEQKIQKHFARNNLSQGMKETDQRDFVNLESEYIDKLIVADLI